MAQLVTLADFQPSVRGDGVPWAEARIEEVDDLAAEWEENESIALDPLDEDPKEPALRSFTVTTEKAWLRIVFVDGDSNEDAPTPAWATTGAPFRPTLGQVSATLRARTYTDANEGLVGGELAGEFDSDTRPTALEVESDIIPDACTDVLRAVGHIPGVYLEDARRVANLGACREIERSYLPEQAEPDASLYQTFRISHDEEAGKLRRSLQWWALSRHLEKS